MHSVFKIGFFSFILLVNLNHSFAQSLNQSDENQEQLFLNEVVEKSTEGDIKPQGLFNETPIGLNTADISPQCDPKAFENRVLSHSRTSSEYYKLLNDYFKNCSAELNAHSPKGIYSLVKFGAYKYSFLKHPQITEFKINLANGLQIPAIMALKPDSTPRPLVIVKCGVFCAAEEGPSLRAYMMSLFDQAPFNVVFLANQTGYDFMKANHILTIGGWTEGREVLEAGRWFKEKWQFKERISSVHLMGISLGGNAAVFGAAYNDRFLQRNGDKIYSSVTAICPVINLKPTLEKLYGSFLLGSVFDKFTRDHFESVRGFLHDVPDLITNHHIPSKKTEMPGFLGFLASSSLLRRGVLNDTNTFYSHNNFWALNQKVQTPLLVWASKNDIVVNNQVNAQRFEQNKYSEAAPNVGVLNLDEGSHCAFQSSYGLLASSTVLKSFVLAHSPEFQNTYQKESIPWTQGFKKLKPQDLHLSQSFEFQPNNDHVKISFKIFNGADLRCRADGPWKSHGRCAQTKSYFVPINELSSVGARQPKNTVEAEALNREFNTKIEFINRDLKNINGTNDSDFSLSWRAGY